MKFIVIGITDNPDPWLPPEVMAIIRQGRVFSGGKRHHEIVAPLLPVDAQWIDITVPLDAVFEQYHDEVVVFASGDPLFFGFANTIRCSLVLPIPYDVRCLRQTLCSIRRLTLCNC